MRAIARELYEAIRELPLICPHGHVDPRRLASDEPFDDPASLLVTSDHYVTRLLHASGDPARRARSRATSRCPRTARARHLAAAVRELGRLPRHRGALLAREPARRAVRGHLAPVAADGRCDLRPDPRAASARTRSGRGRSTPASASRCSRRPTTRATTSPPTGARRRPVLAGEGDPDVPARPVSRGRPTRLGRGDRRARRGVRHRHRRLRRVPRGTRAAAAVLHRARRDRRRSRPRRRAHRSARPRGRERGSTGLRSRARRRRPRRSPSGGTWCSRWRGCRARTGS